MKKRLIAGALMLAAFSTIANAESMWVKSANVDLRGGKGAVFPAVGQAQKGQEVTVVSRDGNWVQVQAGSVQGWVYNSSLSASKVGGDVSLIPTGSATANMNTGIAARGLQGDTEQYVSSKHLNKAPLEMLIALRKSIQPAEYQAFTAQGNLGR